MLRFTFYEIKKYLRSSFYDLRLDFIYALRASKIIYNLRFTIYEMKNSYGNNHGELGKTSENYTY